jgi:hypothetical protein
MGWFYEVFSGCGFFQISNTFGKNIIAADL